MRREAEARRPAHATGPEPGAPATGRDEKGGQVLIVPVRNATCLVRDAS